jgi:hypothetical protein
MGMGERDKTHGMFGTSFTERELANMGMLQQVKRHAGEEAVRQRAREHLNPLFAKSQVTIAFLEAHDVATDDEMYNLALHCGHAADNYVRHLLYGRWCYLCPVCTSLARAMGHG